MTSEAGSKGFYSDSTSTHYFQYYGIDIFVCTQHGSKIIPIPLLFFLAVISKQPMYFNSALVILIHLH